MTTGIDVIVPPLQVGVERGKGGGAVGTIGGDRHRNSVPWDGGRDKGDLPKAQGPPGVDGGRKAAPFRRSRNASYKNKEGLAPLQEEIGWPVICFPLLSITIKNRYFKKLFVMDVIPGGIMNKWMGFLCLIVWMMVASAPCFALYNRQGIPDSSEIRQKLVESWFTAPVEEVRGKVTELHRNNVGTVFQVRSEETDGQLMVVVAPRQKIAVDMYSGNQISASTVDVYPATATGSWVLHRDIKSGEPLFIRYYFASEPEVYMQMNFNNHKVLADFVVFDGYAARGVPVGIPFQRLYKASFLEVFDLTESTLPWNYVNIMPALYHPVLQMIAVIRENLDRITLLEDAAYNEDGNAVYISTGKQRIESPEVREAQGLSLSSAGFLKWIVDGLVIPVAGSYTRLEPLLVSTVQFRQGSFAETVGEEYAVSFSLDWTRNLAAAVLSIYSGRNFYYNTSGCDVQIDPFSAEIDDFGKLANSLGYLKDTGYRINTIKGLLYVLAVTEPGKMYLGAVRQSHRPSVDSPEVQFFTESVAIFPYFDGHGQFQVVIFEAGKELSLETFMDRYKDSYVHLARINASERFFPQ